MGVLNPPFLYGIFDFPLFLSSGSWGSSIFRKPPDDTHGFIPYRLTCPWRPVPPWSPWSRQTKQARSDRSEPSVATFEEKGSSWKRPWAPSSLPGNQTYSGWMWMAAKSCTSR